MDAGRTTGFPRSARLLDGKAYSRVFQKSQRFGNQHWTVLAASRVDQHVDQPARLGLAIAKKRARRAVDRNRLKRIARESFRRQREALAGYDVVVLNRDAATAAPAAATRRSLDQLWGKLQRHAETAAR